MKPTTKQMASIVAARHKEGSVAKRERKRMTAGERIVCAHTGLCVGDARDRFMPLIRRIDAAIRKAAWKAADKFAYLTSYSVPQQEAIKREFAAKYGPRPARRK